MAEQRAWRRLHRACMTGDAVLAMQLGASAKTAVAQQHAARGSTALHEACAHRQEQLGLVKFLVETLHAPIDARKAQRAGDHDSGATPLFLACRQGHAQTVSYLLSRGADARLTTVSGGTPITLSAQQGHLEIVRILVEEGGIDRNEAALINGTSINALVCATLWSHLDVLRFLADGNMGAVNDTSADRGSLLHVACHVLNRSVIRWLVEDAHTDVNALSIHGVTPLAAVVMRANSERLPTNFEDVEDVLWYLVEERGADINAGHRALTPMSIACYRGNLRLAQLLAAHGASVTSECMQHLERREPNDLLYWANTCTIEQLSRWDVAASARLTGFLQRCLRRGLDPFADTGFSGSIERHASAKRSFHTPAQLADTSCLKLIRAAARPWWPGRESYFSPAHSRYVSAVFRLLLLLRRQPGLPRLPTEIILIILSFIGRRDVPESFC